MPSEKETLNKCNTQVPGADPGQESRDGIREAQIDTKVNAAMDQGEEMTTSKSSGLEITLEVSNVDILKI
jgi:hypothetical protein